MRIVLFHNLPSGGAKRALSEQLKILSKKNSIDVFYTIFGKPEDFLNFLDTKKIKYYPFKFSVPKNFKEYLKLIYFILPKIHQKIAQEINKRKYDVALITHDYWTKSPYILRYLNIPSVYWCHEPPREFYDPPFWHIHNIKEGIVNLLRLPIKEIDIKNTQYSNLIITVSRYCQKKLKSIYKRKIFLVRNGVNTKTFNYYHEKRDKIFLSVGALTRLKGHDFLIRSLSQSEFAREFKLVLVGNGGRDEVFLLNLARRLKVNIEIKKFITDKELISLYNKAFLLLYAPRGEPFGLVPLEAMACGLPVLAVAEGGVVESVNKKVGWLVPRDEKKFSIKLDELIKNYPLVEKKRDIVRKYIEKKWTWENSSKQLFRHLKKAINLKKRI